MSEYERFPAIVVPPLFEARAVYFLQAENGLVKIGQSRSVARRIEGLRSISPIALWPVAWSPALRLHEQRLHRIFATERSHGEWFRLSDHLAWLITELNSPRRSPERVLSAFLDASPDCRHRPVAHGGILL